MPSMSLAKDIASHGNNQATSTVRKISADESRIDFVTLGMVIIGELLTARSTATWSIQGDQDASCAINGR